MSYWCDNGYDVTSIVDDDDDEYNELVNSTVNKLVH